MDQFDKAINNIQQPAFEAGPTNILILGTLSQAVEAIRASLEVFGHTVAHANSIASYENIECSESFQVVFVSIDTKGSIDPLFESISLLSPNTVVVGYSEASAHSSAIQFIRSGGSDLFSIPKDLDCLEGRIQSLLEKQHGELSLQEYTNRALRLCDKMNEERRRVEEENDSLNSALANAHCETQKKIQQVAIGAEFQALVSQELEVESMLRTALGYMLTRVGAMNAVVYLREGDVDWGIGAYINYDRQPEQFQSLVNTVGSTVCHTLATEEDIKHFTNGEAFANTMELDPFDFAGNEVVSYGCFSGDRCMAVVVLFRDDSRSFNPEAMDTIETLRTMFGEQLGTILKIHRRAETQWPSESIDDDDWSIDKAA